jgi:hypothetical protein
MHRFLAVTVLLLVTSGLLTPVPCVYAAERPHVYLVVVDGLGANRLEEMVRLAALRKGGACPVTYPQARAVFPTRTNPNHVSLGTGLYPGVHGITGNRYWKRGSSRHASGLDAAEHIEAETLFTIIEKDQPTLRTVGVFGKSKLGRLFGTVAGRQQAPDSVWAPGMPTVGPVTLPKGASRGADHQVMDSVVALLDPEPDFLFASLSGFDLTSHVHGTASDAATRALNAADIQVERLIEHLRGQGRLDRSVVFITGDHGFSDVEPPPGGEGPYLTFGKVLDGAGVEGIRLVSDGGINHVYLEHRDDVRVPLEEPEVERLEAVRQVALGIPGIAAAVYREPVPGQPDAPTVTTRYPTWRVNHPRMGDMVLVAEPRIMFSDPLRDDELGMVGNHGGIAEEFVPLVVCGGGEYLQPHGELAARRPSSVDVGSTIGALLGLRPAGRLDGAPIDAADRGRRLDAIKVP